MIINASIQVVPLALKQEAAYAVIDKVITKIIASGLTYRVGAFETTIEGEYQDLKTLLFELYDLCNESKENEFLIYSKLHLCGSKDILLEQKKLDR